MTKKKKPTGKIRKAYKKYYPKFKAFMTKKRSFKAIGLKVVTYIKSKLLLLKDRILKLLFQQYYGVRLLRPKTILAGYTLLLLFLYISLYFLPESVINASAYVNFTEQALTILIVLLTILLSAGLVLLGDDTRGWSLARMAIIRDVVKLKGLMISCILIILVSITPHYLFWDITLKTLLSPVLLAAFVFILGIYYRLYLWLSDLSADPSFFEPQDPNDPDDKRDDRSYIGSSYRFARIVHLIHYLDARDAWQAVLEKKIPYGYEELLHEEFFDGVEEIISKKKDTKYIDLSVRLEIYDKYYARRNTESWRFYLDYTKRFLMMYSTVEKIVYADRTGARVKGLWRAERALQNINEKLISNSLTSEGSYSLFEAMDAYIVDRDLLYLGDRQNINDDRLLSYFINEYLEKIFKGELETYHIDSYFAEHTYWKITYKNLFEDRFNVTYAFEKAFKDWLFKQLFGLKEKDGLYDIDSLFEAHFTEADPLTIADLYWLLYQGQNTTDSDLIVKLYYTNGRPFGLMGRTFTSDWNDDREASRKEFAKFRNEQIDNAIKLFATRYDVYFLRFWKLDELIKATETVFNSEEELEEREQMRLEQLNTLLKMVKAFYASVDKK